MGQSVTRRNFLKIGAIGTAAAFGSAALSGCSSDGNGGADIASVKWDHEADVVVVGYGGAGASAAIGAARAGATVIVLEKAPEGEEGGNLGVCGGGWIVVDESNLDGAFDFIKAQVPSSVTDEEISGFIDELAGTPEFVESCGATLGEVGNAPGCLYPNLVGAKAVPGSQNAGGPGKKLFSHLKETTESLSGVQVMYETPGYKLVFDPTTKEVFGVVAKQGDAEVHVKAKRGVILALGGYENNLEMVHQYCAPEVPIYPWGTPYNTGDGFPMITEIGAKQRHFASVEWGSFCFKKASDDAGTAVAIVYTADQFENAILVNKYGKRFQNEIAHNAGFLPTPTHDKSPLPQLNYDPVENMEYPNLPFYMVFDETKRAAGPLANLASKDSGQTWCGVHKNFTWSDDNMAEIDKGYLFKADSIEELAKKADIDPATLQETVDNWNAMVASGIDTEFGRTGQLSPISTPPFYLSEMALSFINTQGGPERDAAHRVLDWNGSAIPRLYAGGEFGSIYGFLYQGAGNVPEAMGARVAGENAAAEEPWA